MNNSALPYRTVRENVLGVVSNLQIFLVMITALILKYRPTREISGASSSFDQNGLGIFLIIVNVAGVTAFVLLGTLKYLIPLTDVERKSRGETLFKVIFKGIRTKLDAASSSSVDQKLSMGQNISGNGIVGGGGIEQGDTASDGRTEIELSDLCVTTKARGKHDTFVIRTNPMRNEKTNGGLGDTD